MGHSGDDAVHKIPHNENALAELVETFCIGLNKFEILYRIKYKKIDVILVQCPFKNQIKFSFSYSIFSHLN